MLIIFTMEVEVTDLEQLYEAASVKARENGMAPEDTLCDMDGLPDPGKCIQWLADPGVSYPGTEIQISSTESI